MRSYISPFATRCCLPLVLATAVLQGGCHDYQIIPEFPLGEDAVCVAETQSWYSWPLGVDAMAGTSVELLSTGDETALNLFRWQLTGAPGDPSDDLPGFVRASYAHTSTGLSDQTWTQNEYLVPPPSVGAFYQLGWDVLAVDIRECHPSGSGHYDACGQEVLASAPDTIHTSPGEVFWWMADGQANSSFEFVARIAPPAGSSVGAEFGHSLAAARVPANAETPWDIAGTYPEWVAISAPGDDVVYLYAVDPTSASPLGSAPIDHLPAPIPGRGFGHAMVAADFDADGITDLAVSGPYDNGTDQDGYVWVYRGTGLPTKPLHKGSVLQRKGAQLGPSRGITYHGWSLAAGPIAADHTGDALVVGAPMTGLDDNGGLCQYLLTPSGSGFVVADPVSDVRCQVNEFQSVFAPTLATSEHLGWSVAVGNFHNADGYGNEDTVEARLHELAVGRPGYNGDRGAVNIFATNESGTNFASFWAKIEEYTGPLAGARFGESMASGYVQQTHWEDLVIGAPYADHTSTGLDGSASLTKAVETSSCPDINGYWTLTGLDEEDPSNMVTVQVKTWREEPPSDETHLTFLTEYTFGLFIDYVDASDQGELCTDEDGDALYTLPINTELVFAGAWPCVSSPTAGTPYSHTWSNADLTPMFQALDSAIIEAHADVTGTVVFDVVGEPETYGLEIDLDTLSITGEEVFPPPVGPVSKTFTFVEALEYIDVNDPDNCLPQIMPLMLDIGSVGVCE